MLAVSSPAGRDEATFDRFATSAMLKFARKHGGLCRISTNATLKKIAMECEKATVLVRCNHIENIRSSLYIVLKVEQGQVKLRDVVTQEESSASVAHFARAWHGDRSDRRGRMMTVR